MLVSLCCYVFLFYNLYNHMKALGNFKMNRSPGCLDSILQLICVFESGFSLHCLVNAQNITSRVRSNEFAGESGTVTSWPLKQFCCTFCSIGRCPVLLKTEISIFTTSVIRRKHAVPQNFLVNFCIDSEHGSFI